MKKTTFYSLLTMLFLLTGSNVWAEDSWVKTAPEELQTGDAVVIVELTNSYALPNNNGTAGAPSGVGVSLNSSKTELASDPASTLQWIVTVDATNASYQFGVEGTETFLYCTNSNNGVRVGKSDNNVFTISTEGYLVNTATGRYVGVYTTNPDWRCYTSINNNIKDQSFGFFKKTSSVVGVEKPVITPNGGTFSEPQEVTITAGEGCDIYYTVDGTDPAPTHGKYTEPFTVSETCTVKAVAYDVTGACSSIAAAEFKFPSVITSIAELCAADKGTVTVQFVNWTVTGVKGKNAYFTDGANGVLLFEDGHGFEVGDVLRGTATFNLTTFKGAPEITGLKATSEGVTVAAKNVEVTPMEVTIGQLENNMQGCVIKLTDLTYNGTDGVLSDATGATITPYNSLGITTMPTLEDGKSYDATGVFIWFNGTKEIAPRATEDFVEAGTVSVAKPIIYPAGGTFTEPQEVTLTAGDNCFIFYTLDGTEPTTEGNVYGGPFTISEDCILKAIAYDVTGAASAVATAEFKFISSSAIPSIARLCAAAPAEGEVEVLVEFKNWIVTGVRGGQVYFTDGPNGIILYQSGHGFKLGDKVNGSAVVTLTTFNECAEIMGLSANTEGITVEAGATPTTISRSELSGDTKDKQGCLLYLEGVTYSDGVFIDDDDNTIAPMANKFVTLPTLMEGKIYNVTGVAIWYITDGVGSWMIAPRAEEEVQLVTSQKAPESYWADATGAPLDKEANVVVDINDDVNVIFVTNSDGLVTLESSDETVAIIDATGIIRPVGRGITIITANVAETETYLPDSKSFTLTVTKDGYAEATFVYNDEDIVGQGVAEVGGEITATRNDIVTLYANRAYAKPNDTHIKVYGSSENNGLSYLQLSVVDGYAITQVVIKVTGKSNLGIWKDQFGVEAEVEKPDSVKVTWTGTSMQNKVILTNWASKQARVKTIDVTYVKLAETDKTVTIGKTGIATYCSDATTVVSSDGEWAVAGAVIGFASNSVLVVDTLSSIIPANTGLLLMGAPGEYKVYTHVDMSADVPTANMLTGVLEDTEATVGSYVFQENKGIAGFYQLIPGTSYTVPAGQAYLSVPGVGDPAWFFTELDQATMDEFVEDITTGINGVAELSENGVIYNLAGQRLSKMQKGINVVGGKKILK